MPKLIFTFEDIAAECAALKAKGKLTPGFDKMTAAAAETWLSINGEQLCKNLNSGKHKPMPATGFNVAKASGSYRRLAKI